MLAASRLTPNEADLEIVEHGMDCGGVATLDQQPCGATCRRIRASFVRHDEQHSPNSPEAGRLDDDPDDDPDDWNFTIRR